MKKFLLSIAVLIVLFPCRAGGQSLPFTHYTPDNELNPLPSAEVHKVHQDKLGYMWFVVYSSGLVRYNGVNLEVYGLEDGLSDLTVWDLLEDSYGRLWVSSNAGIVVSEKPLENYTAGEKIRFASEIGDIPLVNVAVNHNRMAADENGVWVGTESLGLVRYKFTDDGDVRADTLSTTMDNTGNELVIRSLVARSNGTVWVALLGGDLVKYRDDAISQILRTGTDRNTNTLYESPDGTLWGGEQNGSIWRLNETGDRNEFIYLNTSSTSNIPDITMNSDGTLWVSSEGSGLQLIDPVRGEEIATYTRANGLLGEIVFNTFEDRENNIWIAQSGGVSKLRYNYKAFRNLTATSFAGERPVLPSPSVNSVLPSRQPNPCSIWAGTSEGGLACINDDFTSEYIQLEDGLTGNWVNGLAYDQSGRLWIGTARGLNSLSFGAIPPHDVASTSNEISIFGTSALLSTYQAASVLAVEKLMIQEHPDSDSEVESIWFPAYQAVYAVVDEQLYTLENTTGLPVAIFHTVAFDGKGYLWVGTRDQGIYRSKEPFTLETLVQNENSDGPNILFEPWWSTENGAPSNQIENMVWQSGSMWVGMQTGLAILEDGTRNLRKLITTREGLRANNAISFALSPITGMLWVGTNQGLAELDPETGTVLRTVTRTDGLVDNEVWFYGSVQFDPDGILYFGTAKGISLYNPETDRINEIPPILKLTNFTAREIQGERNEFLFEYAALSFGNERQVRYQTRLLGFNDEWSAEKPDTRVNYTNLSAIFFPKTYTFEVRAINESGISSEEPLSFEFAVTPPVIYSWQAFLIYFIVLGLGVFAVDRFQRARLIKRERAAAHLRETELKAKALQAENELKASELEKARELEKAYHELKSTQNRLIQAEKMASLGRLSTGIAHEIKNPLNFINNFSEVSRELVDELKTAITDNDQEEIDYILENLSFNTKKIDEHGKRADSIVRSMMQHSRGGMGEFEPVELNQLIKEYIDLAYHGKKSQKNGLDISINTQLDSSITKVNIIPQKIGQVLQNIIENAIDSVWEYKQKVNGEYTPKLNITSRRLNGNIEIRISDNGPGIPEHIKEKIFEPFFTTKATGEGTGLGLSLSYDFITQIHNGKLEIEDSELGGATFVITLPNPET